MLEGRDDAQLEWEWQSSRLRRALDLPDEPTAATPFGLQVRPADKVGMIGYIQAVAEQLANLKAQVYIFDKGLTLNGGEGAAEVMEMSRQPEILPLCDLMIISGTTLINGSIDHLLDLCRKAREIILVGSSTPMLTEAFRGTGVTALAELMMGFCV